MLLKGCVLAFKILDWAGLSEGKRKHKIKKKDLQKHKTRKNRLDS